MGILLHVCDVMTFGWNNERAGIQRSPSAGRRRDARAWRSLANALFSVGARIDATACGNNVLKESDG